MIEKAEIGWQRRTAARILRAEKADLIERWMEKIRLLTREKGPEGQETEHGLQEEAPEFVDLLLARLEARCSDADIASFYHLILEGRQHNVRLADVAYMLLELKSVSKRIIFEQVADELDAFRVSRLVDDTIEAVLRKSADLYELSTEADHLTGRERLKEIYAAWDLEEALADAQTPAEVCRIAAARLGEMWELLGCLIRYQEDGEDAALDVTGGQELPPPVVQEQGRYLTEHERELGGALSALESVRRRREALVWPDVRAARRIINGPELSQAGVGSVACCPLISRERVIGVLLLSAAEPNTFRERDERRLRDLAGVLALALHRAGRLERSRKEISEAEVIARIGRSLLELPTYEALLQGVAEALRAFRDYFDVSLFRTDQAAGECMLVAEAGRGRRYRPDQYRQKIGEGFIGLCAKTGETIRAATELEEDSRRLVAFEEEYRARSELAVPVKRGQEVLGVMHFLSERESDFPESEIAALEHVSPHIGVALQNARMIVQRRRDQYEIEQAHRQLANIIRSTAVGITSTDSEGLYTHWSPSCEALLGHAESDVVGKKTPADFSAAEDPYDLQTMLETCRREGRTVLERTMLRKDGTPRIIRETRVPMADEEGRSTGFTAYLVDITEHKRVEEELRRERDTLSVVVRAMGAGLALFDSDLKLQWANSTMMEWFEFGPESLGQECHEVCTAKYCEVDTCPVKQAVASGRPEMRTQELIDPRGAWRCYQQVFTPVSFGETRLVALTLDITEQRRQTDQMRLINKLTEKVETSLEPEKVLHLVLTCVTAGHAIGLNRAFIFLLDETGQNLVGRMAVGPVSSADARRIWSGLDQEDQSIENLLDTTEPSPGDMRLSRLVRSLRIPLGDVRDTLVSTLNSRTSAHVGDARSDPHIDPELARRLELEEFVCVPLAALEEPLGVMLADNKFSRAPIGREQVELLELFSRQASMAIANARAYQKIRDQLRELHLTRDRLIEAERMASVGRMASHLAHEIRNPLTAIGGFAASIARQHEEDPRTRRNARVIFEEARRLERTLINVLDYTRPLRPAKAPVCVNDIIKGTVEQFASQLEEENVSLRLSLKEGLPQVPADGEMIKQVVINLVKNAIEAMESKGGGTLSIATAAGDGEVHVLVRDSGAGMEPATLEDLFSPFFTTKIGGIGLGLSVSRRIIAQHGGRIEVDSELGVGSTFTVTLALESERAPQGRAGAPSET
ncbi:MAG: GAF domain-containing protein [Planctomycetota bacterium]